MPSLLAGVCFQTIIMHLLLTWMLSVAMWLQGLGPLTGVPSGAILQFRQRWYSTLPDTFENNFKVRTGKGPL